MMQFEDPRVDTLEKENATLRAALAQLEATVQQQGLIMGQQFELLANQDKMLTAAGLPRSESSEDCLRVGRIYGCTRVLGEDQGYLPLPVRDITVNYDGETYKAMDSAWELTEDQRKLVADGASLVLRVYGATHPPVMVMVGRRLQ